MYIFLKRNINKVFLYFVLFSSGSLFLSNNVYAMELMWNGRPIRERVQDLIEFLLSVAGGLFLFIIIFSGISYAVSSGNVTAMQKSKKMFISALLGLIAILLSYAILLLMNEILTQ